MNKTKKILENKVKPQWMVLSRDYWTEGGIINYGVGNIKSFFDTYKEACDYAEKLFLSTFESRTFPMVWVLKCQRTYQMSKEGPAVATSEEV